MKKGDLAYFEARAKYHRNKHARRLLRKWGISFAVFGLICATLLLPARLVPARSTSGGQNQVEGVYYRNCAAARAAGVAPILIGQPGYRSGLDADGDGIACEPYPGQWNN